MNKIRLVIDPFEGELLSCFLFVAKFQNYRSGSLFERGVDCKQ